MTMESFLPVIRAALGLVVAAAVLSLALARRRHRGRRTDLGLWLPAARPQSAGSGTTAQEK